MGAFLRGDFQTAVSLNALSVLAVPIIFSELIFRVLLLCVHIGHWSRLLLVRLDILGHVLLAAAFVCYIAEFIRSSFVT